MIKCCAWFNILVGSVATLGGLNLAVLAIGFGGTAEAVIVVGPMIVAGLLYASSGAILWCSRPSVSGKALIVQGLAIVAGLAYCLMMFEAIGGFDPYDEEHRLFVACPAAGLLLISIQLGYLCIKWLRKDECRPGEGATTNDSDPLELKRRWYQFSVRTLLAVVVVSSVGFAWIGSMKNDRRIVAKVREFGPATVFYAWGYVQTIQLGGRTENTDAALECLKGLMMLQTLSLGGSKVSDSGLEHLKGMTSLKVVALNNAKVTDAGLEHFRRLTKLRLLNLHGTQITDAGLEHLKGLTKLKYLNLDYTRVTDAGLEHLKGLTKLEYLTLTDTRVTDTGLVHLRGLTNLEELGLSGTKVTNAGWKELAGLTQLQILSLYRTQMTRVMELKMALPNCEIRR